MESLLMMACDRWHPCRGSLTKIDNGLRLISVFTESLPSSSKLLNAVLQSISSKAVSAMLRQCASQVQEIMRLEFVHGHNAEDACPLSYYEARARLHESLSALILKAALHASQYGGSFDASAMTLLLEKRSVRRPTQHTSTECTQRRSRTIIKPRISMFEAVSTPRTDSVSLDWREGLMREMSRDVECRYEGSYFPSSIFLCPGKSGASKNCLGSPALPQTG